MLNVYLLIYCFCFFKHSKYQHLFVIQHLAAMWRPRNNMFNLLLFELETQKNLSVLLFYRPPLSQFQPSLSTKENW